MPCHVEGREPGHAERPAIPDNPGSPHLADRIRAAIYVAGSIENPGFTAEHAELLDQALAERH